MSEEAQAAALVWGTLIVLVVDALLLVVWGYRRFVRQKPMFARTWSVADVWWGGQAAIVGLLLLVFPLMVLPFLAPGLRINLTDMKSAQTILWFMLPATLLQNVAFAGVPAWFITQKYGEKLRDIGLPPLPTRRDLTTGLSLGVLALVAGLTISSGLEMLARQFDHIAWVEAALEYEKTNPVAQIIQILPQIGFGGLLLAVLAIGVAAPLGEELFFRGFAFNALTKRFGFVAGLIGSAVLFTLPHSYALGLIPVFLTGLLLAAAYHKTRSLWVPIVLHATNNTASVLLAYFFPSLVS